jgi:hypothetical protein
MPMIPEMQVTNTQVIKTLAALGRDEPGSSPSPDDPRPEPPADELMSRVNDLPAVRRDRAEMARERLRGDQMPSAELLAEKLVGRLVCDRLR